MNFLLVCAVVFLHVSAYHVSFNIRYADDAGRVVFQQELRTTTIQNNTEFETIGLCAMGNAKQMAVDYMSGNDMPVHSADLVVPVTHLDGGGIKFSLPFRASANETSLEVQCGGKRNPGLVNFSMHWEVDVYESPDENTMCVLE